MPLFYLDTSALLKRYKTEKGTNVIDALFSGRKEDDVFVTSLFTAVEVESVAARALKGRLLNKKAYGALLRLFAEDLEKEIISLPVSSALLRSAAEVASRRSTRAGDAIHLATALMVKEAAPLKSIFVTSDTELVNASGGEAFAVLDPEREDALSLLLEFRRT